MPAKRTRFRQIFLTHLRQVKGRLAIAAVGTLGATATELLKPWPLKIILDHVIYDNPLSRALRLLPHAIADDKTRRLVAASRSEEHTSELQSPCNLVCRLLLEKKKKKTIHEPSA